MNRKQLRMTIILVILILIFICIGLYISKIRPLAHLLENDIPEPNISEEQTQNVFESEASRKALEIAQDNKRIQYIEEDIVLSPSMVIANELLDRNEDTMAEVVSSINTTMRAVAFLFSGIGDAETVDRVLYSLNEIGGKGLFLVSKNEIQQCGEQIRKIIASDMQIGLSYGLEGYTNAQDTLAHWLEMIDLLKQLYGYNDVKYVSQISGNVASYSRIAAAAAGLTIVQSKLEAIPLGAYYANSGAEVINLLFPNGKTNLQRGHIVHFRLDRLMNSATVAPELVKQIFIEKSNYPVVPLSDILQNTELLFHYPLTDEEILPEVRNAIYPGQLRGKDEIEAFQSRYIGRHLDDYKSFLPGFSPAELKALDKLGTIENDENYVFLTFDDWGTDYSIDPLLQVLKKHNVKATFFIRTNNVHYNPNLLRSIAMDGHDIASHTDSHITLSNMITASKYDELTAAQRKQLEEDLVRSYEVLQSIVGDIRAKNGPVLTRYFRPPTLAVSRSGLWTVLDCGFTYSISGSYSTNDYEATSTKRLFQQMMDNTRSGAVLVMHMSETAEYTAEAVDLYLTELEAKGHYQAQPLSTCLK